MNAGILPVKRLDRAKQRLAPEFDAEGRRHIAGALLLDALALCEASDFLTWWVVSDDATVLDLTARRGLRTVRDPGLGLNPALSLALSDAARAGADSATVIPADAPLASIEDLHDLVDTGATSAVVVVPSDRDGGTNGLHLNPPTVVEPAFGPNSLAAHAAAAEELGERCTLLPLPSLALDIDTVTDVEELLRRDTARATVTGRLLLEMRPGVVP